MPLPGAASSALGEITSRGLQGDVRKEPVVTEMLSGEPQPAEHWRPLSEAGGAHGCPLSLRTLRWSPGDQEQLQPQASPARAQWGEGHGGGRASLTPLRQQGLTGQEGTEHAEMLIFS